jgi:hypothetical protein
MELAPARLQLRLVAAGYSVVVVVSIFLIFGRYMLYVRHPEDAAAAGGMFAAGDLMLEIFIVCLFLVPTFFLVLIIRHSESMYLVYSKVLLGISLTAPASLALISIPAVSQSKMLLGFICMDRLFASPVVVVWLAVSRLFARFHDSKRWINYALLVEVVTIVVMIVLQFVL